MTTTRQTLVTRLSSLVTAVAATAATAGDLYVNDFATRTSKEAIPAYGVVRTAQPYPAKSAFLCNRPSGNAGTYAADSLLPYFEKTADSTGFGRPSVDGWFVPYFNNIQTAVMLPF